MPAMEIGDRISQFKFHIAAAAAVLLALIALVKVAPRFIDVLFFFWPLLVSTALFLVAVVVFGWISPPPHPEDGSGDKPGEGILDYVAGQATDPIPVPGDGYNFD